MYRCENPCRLLTAYENNLQRMTAELLLTFKITKTIFLFVLNAITSVYSFLEMYYWLLNSPNKNCSDLFIASIGNLLQLP